MTTLILLKTALRAIIRHKGRSFLTVLGIMIGIASIIITFSIGRGAEERIRNQILTMGEGAAYVIPGNVVTRGAVRSSLAKKARLTEDDMFAIRDQIPEIRELSRLTYTLELLEHNGTVAKERVMGADDNILDINENKLKYGNQFDKSHINNRVNVAIIGHGVEEKLFGTEYPIGQTIKMNGTPFTVIGVIAKQDHFWGTEDPNMRTFVPFTVAKKYFRKDDENDNDLGAIAVKTYKGMQGEQTIRKIKRILRFRHNIAYDDDDDFTIFDQESISQAADETSGVIKLFGLIAASISLLVGGIGVMNIMLVSVQERTKEIGIRLAIGATSSLIQLQFLIEAMVLSGIGGIIGIMLGLTGQYLLSAFTNLPSITEILPLVISFLITIVIGIFFGYYPARKASLLNPIDALLER